MYMYDILVLPNPPAVFEDLKNVISEGIPVLVQETIGVIEDLTSIVPDAKLSVVHFRLDIKCVVFVGAV